MWAMFYRPLIEGELRAWRFIAFEEHDERVTEIEETVIEENGEGSFFATQLPE